MSTCEAEPMFDYSSATTGRASMGPMRRKRSERTSCSAASVSSTTIL